MESGTADLKHAAAAIALTYVTDGMKLGLGTGSTAEAFVYLLGSRVRDGLDIIGAATSEHTAKIARRVGIPLAPLDELAPLDLTVDGADETDRNLNLLKGGGGALLREKLVAASSERMIVIADESKLVERLGRFPLPVEVVEFGHVGTARRIAQVAFGLGYGHIPVSLRLRDGVPFHTDCGNVIYDCCFQSIADVKVLAAALSAITGVVEHGLFLGLATTCLISHPYGVECLQ